MSECSRAMGGYYSLLTGPGPAAVAIVRVYGPRAADFVARHLRLSGWVAWPRLCGHAGILERRMSAQSRGHATRRGDATGRRPNWQVGTVRRAALVDADGAVIDDILVSVHAEPPAYDLRLYLHGNQWLVRRCLELLTACGLPRSDPPGSALWSTKSPLVADACECLPGILTLRGARWVLEQVNRLTATVAALADEHDTSVVRRECRRLARRIAVARWFTTPMRVALVGPPNAGKSSLVNALGDRAVSVVSATPGTTRDWVEVPGEAGGFPVVWLDTAGFGPASDPLERAGMERTQALLAEADAAIVVLDATDRHAAETFAVIHADLSPACVALNKSDLCGSTERVRAALPRRWSRRAVEVSAIQRRGLDRLCEMSLAASGRTERILKEPAAFVRRQARLLGQAARATDHKSMYDSLLRVIAEGGPADPIRADGLRNGPRGR